MSGEYQIYRWTFCPARSNSFAGHFQNSPDMSGKSGEFRVLCQYQNMNIVWSSLNIILYVIYIIWCKNTLCIFPIASRRLSGVCPLKFAPPPHLNLCTELALCPPPTQLLALRFYVPHFFIAPSHNKSNEIYFNTTNSRWITCNKTTHWLNVYCPGCIYCQRGVFEEFWQQSLEWQCPRENTRSTFTIHFLCNHWLIYFMIVPSYSR